MTDDTTNTEQSRISADCPNERLVSHECGDTCRHDSDCTLHNEPAYKNEHCGCDRQKVIAYLRYEACRDVPEPWDARLVPVRLREVADYLDAVDG